MPGTHNSATYKMGAGHYAAVVAASRCQSRDLLTQLRLGVRFLDLRVRADGGLCHGRIGCALGLRGALDICGAFLRANSSEVLLVRVKDEANTRNSSKAVDDLVREIAESADYPLYLQMRLPTVGEVRGRIVLLCDWADGLLGLRWGGPSMRIQDEYWQSSGSKKWHIVRKHLAQARPKSDLLHVHFTSATGLPRKVPITIARSVNPKLSHHLRGSGACLGFLGIVAMDFPSAALCELIVRRNCGGGGLDPCRRVRSLRGGCPKVGEYLDNLQCELQAAASRADAALIDGVEECAERVLWLARVYSKVILEHVEAESAEPSVDDLDLRAADAAPRRPSWSCRRGRRRVLVQVRRQLPAQGPPRAAGGRGPGRHPCLALRRRPPPGGALGRGGGPPGGERRAGPRPQHPWHARRRRHR